MSLGNRISVIKSHILERQDQLDCPAALINPVGGYLIAAFQLHHKTQHKAVVEADT